MELLGARKCLHVGHLVSRRDEYILTILHGAGKRFKNLRPLNRNVIMGRKILKIIMECKQPLHKSYIRSIWRRGLVEYIFVHGKEKHFALVDWSTIGAAEWLRLYKAHKDQISKWLLTINDEARWILGIKPGDIEHDIFGLKKLKLWPERPFVIFLPYWDKVSYTSKARKVLSAGWILMMDHGSFYNDSWKVYKDLLTEYNCAYILSDCTTGTLSVSTEDSLRYELWKKVRGGFIESIRAIMKLVNKVN